MPHLIPITRGELVSVYGVPKGGYWPHRGFKRHYKDEKFIRVRENPVDVKSVAGTHFCDILLLEMVMLSLLSSAIDNLLRGASSQALVAGNIMCGFSEDLGVPTISYMP